MVENGRRKGGRLGTNGLCVVTKTNGYKTVKIEGEEKGGGVVLPFFGGSSAEIGGWMEGVRNVLKVSELNNNVKERAYPESLRGKYDMKCGVVGRSREWRRSWKSSEI